MRSRPQPPRRPRARRQTNTDNRQIGPTPAVCARAKPADADLALLSSPVVARLQQGVDLGFGCEPVFSLTASSKSAALSAQVSSLSDHPASYVLADSNDCCSRLGRRLLRRR